jgi:BirA family biotin operon repressor/biotin-[acetyl-CoA-carboxylase] ligase
VGGRLRTSRLGRVYHFLESCASTNDVAAALARDGASEGTTVVADMQTGGRGRLGRVWHSPPGANLYLSVVLRPPGPPWSFPPLTLLAGAAVARALVALGASPTLKWPNDVLLPSPGGLRKACGVLTEMASERDRIRHVVVGIGINVNGSDFPPELAGRASSLEAHLGRRVDRGVLLAAVLDALEPAYDRLVREGSAVALDAWRPFGQLGHRCVVDRDGVRIEGVAVDLDPQGALLLRDQAGEIHRVLSGEIV